MNKDKLDIEKLLYEQLPKIEEKYCMNYLVMKILTMNFL